jgi:flagellar biosynthesis protein FlhF
MRVKMYTAPRMAEAMAQVRAELGAEAVILSSRRVAGGVEVTAALEPDEPLLILPGGPPQGGFAGAAPAAAAADLARHNLPPSLAARLAEGALEVTLASQLAFAPLPDPGARPLLLAGPPGAGKTLCTAKLAARGVMAGRPPLVVTTDGQRAGAAEQLAAFTRVLGLPLAVAPGPGTLGKALARRAPAQPVLIDTAGCDPFDPASAGALLSLARGADAEIVLVLPAGLDAMEAADLARAFAAMGARHMLATRFDTARRLGSVLAAAQAGPLALTEAGTGADVAQGLDPITPAWLAARLRDGRGRDAEAA